MKKVKEVSKIAGVSRRTLQYYDDEEMLSVKRSRENHRLYGKEDMEKAWRILLLQSIGYSLNEIKAAEQNPESSLGELLSGQIERTVMQIADIKRKGLILSRIKMYGLPPATLKEEYTGPATYVGCIEVITEVLGMSDTEVEDSAANRAPESNTADCPAESNNANRAPEGNTANRESYMSDAFSRWLASIDDMRISDIIRKKLYHYCDGEAGNGEEQ